MQAWGETRNGGVFQTFNWVGGPATLYATARAYSEKYPINGGGPLPNACKVRMALLPGQSSNRQDVPSWVDFDWGSAWITRSISVPGPGVYTLFIESEQPYATGILSTLWDNVTWTQLPPITVAEGDPRVVQPGNAAFPESTARIEWTTNVPSSSRVDFGPNQTYGQVVQDSAMLLVHSVLLEGLTHTTTYHFRASSAAAGYAQWTSDDGAFKTPIQFDGIVVSPRTAGSDVVIRWSTDVAATSRAEYGLTPAYGKFTPEDSQLVTTHQMTVTELAEDQTYHFRVWGRNPPNYSNACSADHTFHTLPPPSPTLQNDSFEQGYGGSAHSLYPWVQYTTGDETTGYHPIDGLVGPYPKGGPLTWFASVQAYDGLYFAGAAANWGYKNGGVFQRVYWPAGQLCSFSARYIILNRGGIPGDTRVRLGIDPDGGTEPMGPNVRWWSTISPTNDNRWYLAGLTTTAGPAGLVTVFLDIREQWELEWHVAAVDHARLTSPVSTTIGALKGSEGDAGVILTQEMVTHVDPNPFVYFDTSYYKGYVEEDNRSAGIAVYFDVNKPDRPFVGDRVTLSGSAALHNMEAVVIANEWVTVDSTDPLPRPLGMSTKRIGGATPVQPALFAGGGACNVGLRARVFGRVTWVDCSLPYWDATAIIDDGAGIIDQPPPRGGVTQGLRVKLVANGAYGADVGDYVEATGVVTIEFVDPRPPPYTGDEYFAYTVVTHAPEDWHTIAGSAGTGP